MLLNALVSDQSHGVPPFHDSSDEEDYDLRDVSSDVEIDASELDGIESDGR
jgi:FK506-binding nuclear protein